MPVSVGKVSAMQDTIFQYIRVRFEMQAVERYDSKYAADGPHDSQVTISDPTSVR